MYIIDRLGQNTRILLASLVILTISFLSLNFDNEMLTGYQVSDDGYAGTPTEEEPESQTIEVPSCEELIAEGNCFPTECENGYEFLRCPERDCNPEPCDGEEQVTEQNPFAFNPKEDNEEHYQEENICGNEKLESGEECDDGNTENGDGCSSECKFTCDVITGQNTNIRCRYSHQEGRDEINYNVIDICDPVIFDFIKNKILSRPEIYQEVQNGKFDNAVLKIWEEVHDKLYKNPPPGGICPTDVRYCEDYMCKSIKPSQIISEEVSCALCVEWATVYFSLLRTMNTPTERVVIMDLLADHTVLGAGHGVLLYKSDAGATWVLDGTCDGGRLYKSMTEFAYGREITNEEIELIEAGKMEIPTNRCAPIYIYSFMDDFGIRQANFNEFPDLADTGAIIGYTGIDYINK